MTDQEYLTALYVSLLGRPPDADGLRHWTQRLAEGQPRDAVFEAFHQSAEFQQRQRAQRPTPTRVAFPFLECAQGSVLPLRICDVGAMLMPGEPHAYSRLLDQGRCQVIGFEPDDAERAKRNRLEPDHLVLSQVIGDGRPGHFHAVSKAWYSSLYEPDFDFMRTFAAMAEDAAVTSVRPVPTTRLDDIAAVRPIHLLKLDVQGGELSVIEGAGEVLRDALAIHVEVEFAALYRGQPLFSAIDQALRERGFELIRFGELQHFYYRAGSQDGFFSPGPPSRLLWADAVYFKQVAGLESQGPLSLLRAAYIAHVNYGWFDLAAHLLLACDRAAATAFYPVYRDLLNSRAQGGPTP